MQVIASNYDPRRPTILCINTDQFSRDLDLLRKDGARFNWIAIADRTLGKVQAQWMPQELMIQAYYFNFSGSAVDAAWAKSHAYGRELLAQLRNKFPTIVAVMASNWDYWQDECLRMACRDAGLPFLVLLREHVLTEDWREEMEMYTSCRMIPAVSAVAVAGPTTRKLITAFNLQPDEILRETGFPRFDIWSKTRTAAFDRPVVLFSYRKGYGVDGHFAEMLHRFTAAARQHPAIPFLVKAKHMSDLAAIEEMIPERSANLRVIDSVTLPDVLTNARAVIGFRSLILYEALLTGVPILVPQWGQTRMNPAMQAPSPADEQLKGFMTFYEDPDAFDRDLEQLIRDGRPAEDLSRHQALFARYFCYSPTDSATARVEKFAAEFTAPFAAR